MGRLWVNHGGDVYSGGEQLGDALEVLADSMRVLYVNRNGVKYWTERIRERDRWGKPLPISWEMSLVCMYCSSDKKFVSVEGSF